MKTLFPKFKRERRSRASAALALLLAPLLAYALFVLILFLLDSSRGDGLMLHQYFFESRRQLFVQLLSDGRRGLALFYLAGFLLWFEAYWLARFGLRSVVFTTVVTGGLAAVALAGVFTGMTWGSLLPAVISSLLLSLAVSWSVSRMASR